MDLEPKADSNYPREQSRIATKDTLPAAPRVAYVSAALERVWKNPTIYVLGTFVLLILGYATQIPGTIIQQLYYGPNPTFQLDLGMYAISTLLSFVPSIISQMFLLGVSVATIEEMDTGTCTFQTLFGGFRNGVNVFVTILVSWILLYAGVAVVAVPLYFAFGVSLQFFIGTIMASILSSILMLGYTSFAPLMCIYENETWSSALVRSARVCKRDGLGIGAVLTVTLLINFVGILACCVGVLVTLPLLYVVQAMHYRDYRLTYLGLNGMPKA